MVDIANPDTCQCLKPPFEPFTKVTVQNCGSEAQKPAWRGCAGSLMAEMKYNLLCGRLGSQKKQQHWI